jgi:hypothetical protein
MEHIGERHYSPQEMVDFLNACLNNPRFLYMVGVLYFAGYSVEWFTRVFWQLYDFSPELTSMYMTLEIYAKLYPFSDQDPKLKNARGLTLLLAASWEKRSPFEMAHILAGMARRWGDVAYRQLISEVVTELRLDYAVDIRKLTVEEILVTWIQLQLTPPTSATPPQRED